VGEDGEPLASGGGGTSGGRDGGGGDASSRLERLVRVCSDKVVSDDCGDAAAAWLSAVVGETCRLVRQNADAVRLCRLKRAARHRVGAERFKPSSSENNIDGHETNNNTDEEEEAELEEEDEEGKTVNKETEHDDPAQPPPKLSLANESQFLLVSEASMDDVNARIASGSDGAEGDGPVSVDRFRGNLVLQVRSFGAADRCGDVLPATCAPFSS
jgi:uncharacterized protein YcbX